MDAEISKSTKKILEKQGMKFKLNTKVVEGDDSGETVHVKVEAAKGGKQETVNLDSSSPMHREADLLTSLTRTWFL